MSLVRALIEFVNGSGDRVLVSDSEPLPVDVVAGSITAGTEYTEGGATDATFTGPMSMAEGAGDAPLPLSTGTGAHPLDVTQAALSSVDLPWVQGTVASDGADSGNPVKVGFKAVSASITAVTANDRVDAVATLTGIQIVRPYALSADLVSGTTAAITDTTTTQVVAGVASKNLHITQITVSNSHATVATLVTLEEETSGTDLYKIYCPAVGGGAVITLPAPLRVPTAGKGLFALCGTTGSNVYVSASGFTGL